MKAAILGELPSREAEDWVLLLLLDLCMCDLLGMGTGGVECLVRDWAGGVGALLVVLAWLGALGGCEGESEVRALADVLECGAADEGSTGAASEASSPVGGPNNEALSPLLDVGMPAGTANTSDIQHNDSVYADNPGSEGSPELQDQCMHLQECPRCCMQI